MNRLRNSILSVATLALLAGCAATSRAPGAAAPFRDTLVVPNKRIGAAVLGMTTEQMVAWLGRPDTTVGSGDNAYRYAREGLQIAFDQEHAYILAITKPGYATADGIAVGIAAKQLTAKWGAPTQSNEVIRCVDRRCETTEVETLQYCFGNGMQADVRAADQTVAALQVREGGCRLP